MSDRELRECYESIALNCMDLASHEHDCRDVTICPRNKDLALKVLQQTGLPVEELITKDGKYELRIKL